MKTKLILTTTLAAALCATPLFAKDRKEKEPREKHATENFAAEKVEKPKLAPEVVREHTARLEARSALPVGRQTVSKEYIQQRLDWLKIKDPRHLKAHAYFETLITAGYDPLLLDGWLDGLYDGVVVVGMPGDLVVDYYGEPAWRKEVIFEGAPAVEWGVQLLPGRVEKITVVSGKVVRVRG